MRTVTYGTSDKKTLVLMHGLAACSVHWGIILGQLAEHYRIVMFDNCNWGLNSKTEVDHTTALESPDAAEEWFISFITQTMEQLDLPDRFYLAGHSYGAYLASLYASLNPERVESLFMLSPACMETYDPDNYNLEEYNDMGDPSKLLNVDEARKTNEMAERRESPAW